ncbi:hypothetical protein Scep_012148 [Stephania cephalantha]|uniref:Uncharacterized protein n=1 Tax=Stephania cephalantha TaxID=152367 RepID=A0AAP0JFH3_9MAGN
MGAQDALYSLREENRRLNLNWGSSNSEMLITIEKKPDGNSTHLAEATIKTESKSVNADPSKSKKVKTKKSCRRRNCVDYALFDISSEEESDCENSTQISARWNPNEALRPVINEAPVFYPTEEEFKDTLGYIAKIRQKAESYGICRIVPPSSWKPPCPLRENNMWEHAQFSTRVQQVDKLQNREPVKRKSRSRTQRKRKRRKYSRIGASRRRTSTEDLETSNCVAASGDEKFGFHSGSDYTLKEFKKYADDFKERYFGMKDDDGPLSSFLVEPNKRWEPTIEDIEGEYWRIVEKQTNEIEVLYGADVETGSFGSGFPTVSSKVVEGDLDQYVLSGWNLNKFPRLPGSVLCYEGEEISGVLVPWLYVGMCFSSFCWHVEDHHLYSLNYLHLGAPKLWYGVPGEHASALEDAMRKHLPALFKEQPDLLHELVTQLSPSVLSLEGLPVYRAVQHPGEFVLTFPRAYHSGFNCGFNCAEAVNVAPVDWLSHGQSAVELYSKQCRKTSVSHDKLLLGAARNGANALLELLEAKKESQSNSWWKSVCGKDGVLTAAIKTRVAMEQERRDCLPILLPSLKMDRNFDSSGERECFHCFYDLHLSAAGCKCSPDRYACLRHAKLLCSCETAKKFFVFRYDMDELNTLIKALEGNLEAIRCWAEKDLKLVGTSDVCASVQKLNEENQLHPDCTQRKENSSCSLLANEFQETSRPCNLDHHSSSEVVQPSGESDHQSLCSTQPEIEEMKTLNGEALIIRDATKMRKERYIDLNVVDISEEHGCFMQEMTDNCNDKDAVFKTYETDMLDVFSDLTESEFMGGYTGDWFQSTLNHSSFHSNLVDPLVSASVSNGHQASCSRDVRHTSTSGTKLFGIQLCSNPFLHAPTTSPVKHENVRTSSSSETFCNNKCHSAEMLGLFVEPLNFGTVVQGKRWCSELAIFPKGFRSRVRFHSILNPKHSCYYISEVVDAGLFGPLFKVFVEDCPTEVFIDSSAQKCWDLVLARLNYKIIRQDASGNHQPSLPLQRVNGLEMFGFCSPSIMQAIEALDSFHQCLEYWNYRGSVKLEDPSNTPVSDTTVRNTESTVRYDGLQIGLPFFTKEAKMKIPNLEFREQDHGFSNKEPSEDELHYVLRGLFSKANKDELKMMHMVFCSKRWSHNWKMAFITLIEELERCK